MKSPAPTSLLTATLLAWALSGSLWAEVADSDTNAPPVAGQAVAALTERLEEQHKVTMWFLDRLRQNLEDTTRERDQALADTVQSLERSFATQARREGEWIEQSQRLTLLTACGIGGAALFLMLLAAVALYRAVSRHAQMQAVAVYSPLLNDAGPIEARLDALVPAPRAGPTDQADRRLLLAVERLEKRVAEMESHGASVSGQGGGEWRDH